MSRGTASERAQDGFVIVAVLWILAALAALVSVYAVHVIDTASGSKLGEDRVRAEALIGAAVELAAHKLTSGLDKTPPAVGAFSLRIGTALLEVQFRSEGARVDLNLSRKELLAGLLTVLGADSDDAAIYADRIIGWRRKTDVGGRNEEVEEYQRAGLPYLPRQAPFQSVAELRLVLGLPPELVDRMLPYVTVFNGRAEIDVMAADPTIVLALPDMSRNLVEEILKVREEGDPKKVLELLGNARTSVATEGRKAARLDIRIALDSGRRINAEVVILLMDGGFEPYRILAWRDDLDRPGA